MNGTAHYKTELMFCGGMTGVTILIFLVLYLIFKKPGNMETVYSNGKELIQN